jgi:hypothetical protein
MFSRPPDPPKQGVDRKPGYSKYYGGTWQWAPEPQLDVHPAGPAAAGPGRQPGRQRRLEQIALAGRHQELAGRNRGVPSTGRPGKNFVGNPAYCTLTAESAVNVQKVYPVPLQVATRRSVKDRSCTFVYSGWTASSRRTRRESHVLE